MEVILVQEVEHLGHTGETVNVKDGYAHNFLIPRGLALPATSSYRRQIESRQAIQLKKAEVLKAKAVELGQRLATVVCTLAVSVGDQGKLHGAVTVLDILKALEGQGVVLEKHQVSLEGPITQLGVHRVSLKLHPEVQVFLRVCVVPR